MSIFSLITCVRKETQLILHHRPNYGVYLGAMSGSEFGMCFASYANQGADQCRVSSTCSKRNRRQMRTWAFRVDDVDIAFEERG